MCSVPLQSLQGWLNYATNRCEQATLTAPVPRGELKTVMKSRIRRFFQSLGYDVHRYDSTASPSARLGRMLAYQKINLVLDIGANIGQFGHDLRRNMGYRGRIVSFEPTSNAYSILSETAKTDELWQIAPRVAIGAMEGEVKINLSMNSVSSSILPMMQSHIQAAPESQYVASELVPVRRLDNAAAEYVDGNSAIFLKIDTQGYERQVLEGGQHIVKQARGAILEVSVTNLYDGAQLLPEMLQYMTGQGFELWGLSPAFVEPETGRSLQLDAVFFRPRTLRTGS